MSADQKSIDKKIHMFNVIQLAVRGSETTPLDECAVVDGMFPWTINGTVPTHNIQYNCTVGLHNSAA